MIKIKLREQKEECPPATQDSEKNSQNRQHAIEEYGYGPFGSEEKFWADKAQKWEVSEEEAKKRRCGNCEYFDMSSKMKDCIAKGLDEEEKNSSLLKQLGYCRMYKFKCSSSHTCDSWEEGGPIR